MSRLASRGTARAGLAAAVVAFDVALLVAAWMLMHPSPPPPGASLSTSQSATQPLLDSAADTGTDATDTVTGPLFLVSSPDGAVARVTRGSCDARDVVPSTVWTQDTPGEQLIRRDVPQLVEALGVDRPSRKAITIVGATSDCSLKKWTSGDAGASWSSDDSTDEAWHLDTDTTAGQVIPPKGSRPATFGCRVNGFDLRSEAILGWCTDAVTVADIAGDEAPVRYPHPGVGASAFAADGTTPLILTDDGSCIALVRLPEPNESVPVSCVADDGAPLGLAVAKKRVYAQVGSALLMSTDSGRTWAELD